MMSIAFSFPEERRKSIFPQSCLDALSIKVQASKIQWTLRPGKGPQGNVRFIYQSNLLGINNSFLSLEKKKDVLYLSQKIKNQTHFYKLTFNLQKKCYIQLLRTEKFEEISSKPTRKETNNKKPFNDQDLENLLQKSKEGIIYLWSPHMPYSIGSLYPLQKITNKLGLRLTVLMDSFAHEKEVKKVIQQFSLPVNFTKKNKAKKLLFHGGALHYPNYFFYKEGKLSPIQLFGAKGEEAIYEVLTKLSPNSR